MNYGKTERMRGQGRVLGGQPEWTYEDFTLALAPGDRLLFFTDGRSEAENHKNKEEEFGYGGITEATGSRPRLVHSLGPAKRYATRFTANDQTQTLPSETEVGDASAGRTHTGDGRVECYPGQFFR